MVPQSAYIYHEAIDPSSFIQSYVFNIVLDNSVQFIEVFTI